MFVRVKRRKSLIWWKKDEGYLSVYLVSSYRTPSGPRHRQHGYCGTVAVSRGRPVSIWALHWFWGKVEARLAALALPPGQEEVVRAALRQWDGPQPSQEGIEADLLARAAVISQALT